jgi:hypothetical protein
MSAIEILILLYILGWSEFLTYEWYDQVPTKSLVFLCSEVGCIHKRRKPASFLRVVKQVMLEENIKIL